MNLAHRLIKAFMDKHYLFLFLHLPQLHLPLLSHQCRVLAESGFKGFTHCLDLPYNNAIEHPNATLHNSHQLSESHPEECILMTVNNDQFYVNENDSF